MDQEKKWNVNGKTYDRLEDMPLEYRRLLEDRDQDGVPDSFERRQNSLAVERGLERKRDETAAAQALRRAQKAGMPSRNAIPHDNESKMKSGSRTAAFLVVLIAGILLGVFLVFPRFIR